VHDQLRVALCALWAAGSLADPAASRRQLLKLTRTSWALAYEAVAAAFRDAADAVAWQLGALLDRMCALDPPCLIPIQRVSCSHLLSCEKSRANSVFCEGFPHRLVSAAEQRSGLTACVQDDFKLSRRLRP